jgi:heat shock protein HslJ
MIFLTSLKLRSGVISLSVLLIAALVMWYLNSHTSKINVPTVDTTSNAAANTATPSVVGESLPFEDQTNPLLLALDMKPWKWVSAMSLDGALVTPSQVDAFKITFNANGAFTATTDCNSISGSYEAYNGSLSLGSIASTEKYCEGSEEGKFFELLVNVRKYHFTDSGQLVMTDTNGLEIIFR